MKICEENKKYYEFLAFLDKNNIKYILLENTTFLSQKVEGDIDIFINNIAKFEQFLKENNIRIIQKLIHHYKGINYYILFEDNLLNIDVYEKYIISHKEIFDEDFFDRNKIKINNLYFLNEKAYVKYYIIKKIIKEDLQYKKEFFYKYLDVLHNIIQDKISPKNTSKLLEYLCGKNNSINLEEIKNDILKNSKICINSIFFELKRIFYRMVNSTGFIIAFLGPDGSGKSTIINLLKNERNLPFRRIDYFHLKPRTFGKKGDDKPVKDPHNKPAHKGIKSYLKLLYFAIDYIIGYWLKVYPLKVKSSLIIFDRYYDDILVDPKRYRYGGSLKIAKLLRFLIPKPYIYIVLITNPEIIYKRKQEVDFEELKRQIKEYEKLADNKKFFIINVDKDPNEIISGVKKLILEKLIEK